MDVESALRALRRWWYLTAISVVIFLVAGFAWFSTRTAQYEATAEIFVSSSPADTTGDAGSAYQLSQLAQDRMATYAALIRSPQVLEPVKESLGLSESNQALAAQLSALNPPGTVLLAVTATSESPTRAAQLANATAEQLAITIEQFESPRNANRSPLRATLATPATVPESPASPGRTSTFGLALFLGLVVGLAAPFAAQALDTKIRSEDALRDVMGEDPIGIVPKHSSKTAADPSAEAALLEPYRRIRTSLRFASVDRRLGLIAVTSAQAGEGKTTTAVDLAIVIAQTGSRVCLVDVDLRRPRLAERLGIESQVGLSNVLAGDLRYSEAVIPWGRGLMDVMTSGERAPNPHELVASDRLKNVLERLRAEYDVVLLDTAPILPVSDGTIVCAAADGALIVARHGLTTRHTLMRTRTTLQKAGVHIIGAVYNGAPLGSMPYYGSYAYDSDS